MASCGLDATGQVAKLPIPLPALAEDVRVLEEANGTLEVSFTAADRNQSPMIRDFYSNWAQENGWVEVPATEDRWSTDRWVSFDSPDGVMHQYTIAWRDAARTRSLLFAIRRAGASPQDEYFVILAPYVVVDDPATPPMSVRDLEEHLLEEEREMRPR